MTYTFIEGSKKHQSGPNGAITRVVIHATVSPCRKGGARANARYFQSDNAGGLAHYCLTPFSRVLTRDMQWVDLGDLGPGDEIVGTQEDARPPRPRTFIPSTVLAVERRVAPVLEIVMADGTRTQMTHDHRVLRRQMRGKRLGNWYWTAASDLAVGDTLSAPLRPWDKGGTDMAWLGGLIDGEGNYNPTGRALSFSQKDGAVFEMSCSILDRNGIPYTISKNGSGMADSQVNVVRVSGVNGLLQTLGQSRPVRFQHREDVWSDRAYSSWRYPAGQQIAAIYAVGDREVVPIKTSTGTFIADGMVQHNCVDPAEIIQCCKESIACWHAPPNPGSIGIELCDPQSGDPDRWRDPDHEAMLRLAARLVADVCRRNKVPLVKITAADLVAGKHGICGHDDVSHAFHESTHTDPNHGGVFPWAHFMDLVRSAATPHPAPYHYRRNLAYKSPMLRGDDVKHMQQRLIHAGYLKLGADDGVFGRATKTALAKFQAAHKLPATGVLDHDTAAILG